MRYFLPPEKWEKIEATTAAFLSQACKGEPQDAKEVAAVLGRILSLIRSHGNIVRIMSRALQHQLGLHVLHNDWRGALCLSPASIAELTFLLGQLQFFNGRIIPSAASVSHVLELSQTFQDLQEVTGGTADRRDLLVSDVSDTAAFIFLVDGTFRFVADYPVNSSESSTSRELEALVRFLHAVGGRLASRATCRLYWQTDSQAAVWAMQRGSRVISLQAKVREIVFLEKQHSLSIIPVWTPREHQRVVFADLGSRIFSSTDEWSIDREDLATVFFLLGFLPDPDCFATTASSVAQTFFSVCPQKGSAGIDFFAQNLVPGRRYFVCPPVQLAAKAFLRFQACPGVEALFAIPDWQSGLSPQGCSSPLSYRIPPPEALLLLGLRNRLTLHGRHPHSLCLPPVQILVPRNVLLPRR